MRSQRIERILRENISAIASLEIVDQSDQHAGRKGTESHFKVLVISDFFEGQSRVQRQRVVQQWLADEFSNGLHALSMRLLSQKEAVAAGSFETPDCAGGNKA